MEVHLHRRAVKQIRVSAAEAIEEGDTDALQEDILESFPEEAIEEIDTRLGAGDFPELLTEILGEWSGDDVDELFEILETTLADQGVDLKYETPDIAEAAAAAADDDDDDEYGDSGDKEVADDGDSDSMGSYDDEEDV